MQANIFKTKEEQIKNLTESLHLLILKILKKKGNVVICVSGGKSPIPLFNKLSNMNLPWDKITITLVDERITATSSEDSNENLVKTYLLQNYAKTAKFVGLVNMDKISQQMVDTANMTISNIDIALLGMGEDGHTASIFPDCSELRQALDMNNRNKYICTNPISAKYSRISLTLNAINQIPELFLIINGEIKFKVYNEALKGQNLNYPISFVLANRPDIITYWYE